MEEAIGKLVAEQLVRDGATLQAREGGWEGRGGGAALRIAAVGRVAASGRRSLDRPPPLHSPRASARHRRHPRRGAVVLQGAHEPRAAQVKGSGAPGGPRSDNPATSPLLTRARPQSSSAPRPSEMFSDGVMDLALCGALTNAHKASEAGKITGGFAMGTER